MLDKRFSSPSFLSDPLAFFIDISRFYLSYPSPDRIRTDFRPSGYFRKISSFLRLHCQILPPLLLIETHSHLFVLVFSSEKVPPSTAPDKKRPSLSDWLKFNMIAQTCQLTN